MGKSFFLYLHFVLVLLNGQKSDDDVKPNFCRKIHVVVCGTENLCFDVILHSDVPNSR